MQQVLQQLDSLRHFNTVAAIHWADILLVTFLFYQILVLIRGTRAWRLAFGIAGFVILLGFSKVMKLNTLNYILDRATQLGPVALVILFLPELRQTLEGFGKLVPQNIGGSHSKLVSHTLEEIVAATTEMSVSRVGALIVVEKEALLDTIIANGTMLDAKVSTPLLVTIFYEGNPLHDGATILRGDRVVAAACRLPLSESSRIDSHLHMRHRAAVGITETTDCLAVVVSEERGKMSIAKEGRLYPIANSDELRTFLNRELRGDSQQKPPRRKLLPTSKSKNIKESGKGNAGVKKNPVSTSSPSDEKEPVG